MVSTLLSATVRMAANKPSQRDNYMQAPVTSFRIIACMYLPLLGALCAWSNMQKENGDTEIAFLAALFYWVVTIAAGWMSKSVFEAWQNGTAFELVSRKARFLNFFPTWFVFIVSIVAVAFMAFLAVKQTLKFVRYLRD